MIDWIQRNRGRILASIVVVFILIPLIINYLFVIGDTYPLICVKWNAGDVLGFYGAVLAAIGAIVGVYLSIQQAQKSYREDIKNQVLPYIAITQLKGRTTYNAFADNFGEDKKDSRDRFGSLPAAEYKEGKLSEIYFVIEKEKIVNYLEMPEKYSKLLLTSGAEWIETAHGVSALTKTPYISMPIEIENVGKGPALYLRIGFYPADDKPGYLSPIVLKTGQTFYIHIFSALSKEELSEKYILDFVYQDVHKNWYSQRFPFEVKENVCTLDLNVEQKEMSMAQIGLKGEE